MSDLKNQLENTLNAFASVHKNPARTELIQSVLDRNEAVKTPAGALLTWTPPESTGRSPKDTFIVKHGASVKNVDWSSPAANAISPDDFDEMWNFALEKIETKNEMFVMDRVIGADAKSALAVKVVTDQALTCVFADNMFRPVPDEIGKSILENDEFTLLSLPYEKIPAGRLRPDSGICVAMDFERKLGLILGSAYLGSLKKLMFTTMNYFLPEHKILPLHCSGNEGKSGDTALILGLSGTGKTTLSADPARALLGDDEHSWSDDGVANFENGCYAKLIDLNPKKEPEIHRIVFGEKIPALENGVIIENAMMFPNGEFDLADDRITANSRTSYTLDRLKNFKPSSVGGHPKTILFLTADANGVLPPVAKLDENQAMLWFLMGYTSKLAGTETGITEPKSAFSRFFGEPFMPRKPEHYTDLLKEKMATHGAHVYLVNTGWSGGAYGEGKRMDIAITRKIVDAALSGDLENVEFRTDDRFHVQVPESCPGVDAEMLDPKNTWKNPADFEKRADQLAADFATHFEKNFSHLPEEISRECPGK
ncbi:phosphoenolpyruvate carboxykinase (ATP) [bacterium]|jgi:phosphoenolpyruvate carboxykinase (ATP)|nr:phosphoenolpyruvate carboxykinase (ATP) [bacterium]MBT6832012.1 phosphoenolpyruvate carboxykinase (ATP) [bacterium]MBT6996722.1 phosphoenolpyruvate carboxykinase (ATP) [bacterium]MBT7772690.1 phosphoenolpyruvate carboxykinase (ATP) [bacterium]